MGILDGLLSNVLGSVLGGGGGRSLAQAALDLVQQHGGLPGIVDRFKAAGLGAQADSWVGTGANQPISAADLQRALGSGDLTGVASRFGLSSGDMGSGLAQMLPELINQLTPQGQIPENHADKLREVMEQLGNSQR
ncbi:MAG: DUF937 domain-containing protein [Burkholderiales bacterium]|nr:MAG: DUF937 domain-containing protein [Burkholderiales bacterium]